MSEPRASLSTETPVLITGGGGFIGSHLCEHLVSRGHRVTVIDDFSTGRQQNLDSVRASIEVVDADLSIALSGPLAGRRFAAIYHLAAAVGVQLVIDRPIQSIETNVLQTAGLLRYARTAGLGGRPAPTLIASSSEVYGKSERTPFKEDDDVVYGPTTKARWSYASTKAIDEYLALAHHQQCGVPAVVARFFNTVGPRQVGEYGMVLPRFVQLALRGQPLVVHGDGQQVRCFCDVRDVAPAVATLLTTPSCAGRVFNVGSDVEITIESLARTVVKTLGSSSDIVYVPYDRAFGSGFEDLRRRRPDLTRVREAIGFVPTICLEQTIKDIARELTADAKSQQTEQP